LAEAVDVVAAVVDAVVDAVDAVDAVLVVFTDTGTDTATAKTVALKHARHDPSQSRPCCLRSIPGPFTVAF